MKDLPPRAMVVDRSRTWISGELQIQVDAIVSGIAEGERLRDLVGRHLESKEPKPPSGSPIGPADRQGEETGVFVDLIDSKGTRAVCACRSLVAHLNVVFGIVVVSTIARHNRWGTSSLATAACQTNAASRSTSAGKSIFATRPASSGRSCPAYMTGCTHFAYRDELHIVFLPTSMCCAARSSRCRRSRSDRRSLQHRAHSVSATKATAQGLRSVCSYRENQGAPTPAPAANGFRVTRQRSGATEPHPIGW